ncbi:hypothetical protein JHK82_043136 [Glycine max]|uniref:Uncharacterized protein n=1 Tax=Glycine max TaxID=3847 RepID=C6SZ19_SOYBN|nr:unknown [Glycine max]KAG4957435.1 hypothetical protein JHK85_043815 [Glycine max]KAG5106166.1 hypothetical protein JHK82_043136 [Glycine max]KAG5117251.1 hypothetical protein JHK84_043364 [Glycine max]KAH1148250.1 hypothetical protein GYH30_043073 [Glycine max]
MLPMMAFPMAATTFPPERDRPASSIQTCKWVSVSLCEVSVSGTLSSVRFHLLFLMPTVFVLGIAPTLMISIFSNFTKSLKLVCGL